MQVYFCWMPIGNYHQMTPLNKSQPTILLVTESSQGHHIAFMEMFMTSLKSIGCCLVVLMPQVQHLVQHLQSKNLIDEEVIFEDFQNAIVSNVHYGTMNEAIKAFRRWRLLNKTVGSLEKKHKLKFDLVFLSFADVYTANYLPHQLVDLVFQHAWAGLYFHPKFLRLHPEEGQYKSGPSAIDNVFRSKHCKAVAIHDQKIADALAFRTGKPVYFFPEIADLSAPDFDNALYKLVKEKAKGKKAIGLVGCEKRKGFHVLKRLAQENPDGYLFVFAGAFVKEGYTPQEHQELKQFLSQVPSNVLYIPTYLKEGVEINSFLAALDAIFIVYSNFTSTSNFSTKAAFLRKPVLATEKHVIGDETRTFDLGVCVGENDVEELRTGLQVLEEKIKKGQFGYDAYLEKHSTEVLVEGFRHILNTLYA
jgi:hypothetical protein